MGYGVTCMHITPPVSQETHKRTDQEETQRLIFINRSWNDFSAHFQRPIQPFPHLLASNNLTGVEAFNTTPVVAIEVVVIDVIALI